LESYIREQKSREIRTFVASELRATGSDRQPRIEGYAATFGAVANIGGFSEVIQRGAFSRRFGPARLPLL